MFRCGKEISLLAPMKEDSMAEQVSAAVAVVSNFGNTSRSNGTGKIVFAVLTGITLSFWFIPLPAPHHTQNAQSPSRAISGVRKSYDILPITFEANQGQADPNVKFLSRGLGYT